MKPKNESINIPVTGFLRLEQIIGSRKKSIPPLIPISRSAWYRGVNSGEFPNKIKIGCSSVWRVEDILDLIERLNNQSA